MPAELSTPADLDDVLAELKAIRRLLDPGRPLRITVDIGGKEFDAHIAKIADQVRVEANRRPGCEKRRIYA